MAFDLTQIVAPPGYAPKDWQSNAPREAYGHRQPVASSPDLARVLALPRRALELDGTERAEAIIDMVTERFSRGDVPCDCAKIDPERHAAEGCIKRMRLVQALALREIGIVGGLLGPIGVGHGKTLIDLLAPIAFSYHALAENLPGAADLLCVLLVPSKLIVQLIADYEYIGQHFRMPSLVIQGNPYTRISAGMPRLQVMPYSRLSRKDATDWFRVVQPHAIIADECHKLRNRGTATTGRVMRYFDEHSETRLAAWSGSITSKSVKDYAHLSALALKFGSPLPIDYDVVEDWARAIDPSTSPADPGPLFRGLIESGCCKPGESFYQGVRRRITETLGVVSTSTPAVDCELELLERPVPNIPGHVKDLIAQAMEFVRPDGEEFITAMQAVECACQLACGFHYRWIYPKHVFPRDSLLVGEWLCKRAAWHKECRTILKNRDEHLDSPQLVEHAAQRALGIRPKHKGLPVLETSAYAPWLEIKPKVQHESDAVRVDDFLVHECAKWAQEYRGLMWYQYTAFAAWVAEVTGIPMYAGGDVNKAQLVAEKGNRSVLASIKSHGTGTNGLQFHFSDQIFINPPAASDAWEQPLGRLHRAGQPADRVRAWFFMHTPQLRKHIRSALASALYGAGTIMGQQKLTVGFPLELEAALYDDEE